MLRSQLKKLLSQSLRRSVVVTPRSYVLVARPVFQFSRFNSSSTTVTTDGVEIPKSVLELSVSDYHKYANETLESMIEDLEDLMDTKDCGELDAELSTGILTLSVPNNGDYVINKQPPNKQIWLSSPVSGPNRFDYIDGEWVSLRDHDKLLDVVSKELGEGLGFEFEFTKAE